MTLGNNPTFFGCTNIENVIYEEGVTQIIGIGCKSAQNIVIPESAVNISQNAFNGYTNLTILEVPESVANIGTNAFKAVPHVTYNGTALGSPWGALAVN